MEEKEVYIVSNQAEFNDFHWEDMPYPIYDEQEKPLLDKQDSFEKWILKNMYYGISFYNQPNYKYSFPWDNKEGRNSLDEKNIWWYSYPLCQQLLNCMYVMQQQPNLNYKHLVENVFSTNSHAAWMRGGRLASVVDYMMASFRTMFDGVKFTTEPISADAISEKDKKLKKEQLLLMLKPYVEKYLKDILKFPQQQKPFETPEQIQEYMDTEWKDLLGDDYKKIAKYIWKSQYWEDDLLQMIFDVLTNDLCGIEHIVINGIQHKLLHRSWNLIYDNRVDEPYGRRRRFAGALIQETPSEIFNRISQLSKKQRKDLYQITKARAGNNISSSSISNAGGVDTMWNNSISNFSSYCQDLTINTVRLYWIAPEKITGAKESNLTVYTGELIENKYLVNYGKANNIVYNKNNPQDPMLPLQVFTPNMKLGFPNSPVQRVRNIQDKIDKIEFKREEIIGKADGMLAFIDGEPFGNNNSPLQTAKDFKTLGYTMMKMPDGNHRLIESWDRRVDANGLQQLQAYKQELEQEMEKSLGQTAATLGENSKYVGKEAYADNAERASAESSNLLTMTARFVQMNVEFSVNIQKNLIASDVVDGDNIVGSDGVWRIKNTKDKFTMDFGIPIELNDKMDIGFKDNLFKILQPKLQNPNSGYTEGDIAKLYMITNFSKFRDELKTIDERIKKERMQAQQMQLQIKQNDVNTKLQSEIQQLQMELGVKAKVAAGKDDVNREKLDLKRQEMGLPPEHPHTPAAPSAQAPPPQQDPNQPPIQQ